MFCFVHTFTMNGSRHAMTILFGQSHRRCAMCIIPTARNARRETHIYLYVSRKLYPRVSVSSLNHFGDDVTVTICLSKFSNKFSSTNWAGDHDYDYENSRRIDVINNIVHSAILNKFERHLKYDVHRLIEMDTLNLDWI